MSAESHLPREPRPQAGEAQEERKPQARAIAARPADAGNGSATGAAPDTTKEAAAAAAAASDATSDGAADASTGASSDSATGASTGTNTGASTGTNTGKLAGAAIRTEAAPAAPLAHSAATASASASASATATAAAARAGSAAAEKLINPLSTEKRIARLSNFYIALSRTNEAISRESDPLKLCHAVCEIAVTHGRLVSSSVRLYDASRRELVPFCGYGPLEGWIGEQTVALDDPRSRAAWVARELRPYISNDVLNDPAVAVARADAERVGVRASGGMPLSVNGELVGVLSVYAGEVGFFDDELTSLLGEMARNLSFAFAKHSAEAALKSSEEHYRMLFDAMPEAIRVTCDDRVVLLNPAGARLLGVQSAEEVIGRPLEEAITPANSALALARTREVARTRKHLPPVEIVMRRGDGQVVECEVDTLPFEYHGRPAALTIIHDLTARKAAERRIGRLTSLYAALSRTNEAIFRLTDLRELCQAVCEVAVRHGGLFSSSIRLLNKETGLLERYAGHGPVLGRVGAADIAPDDPHSSAARVLREGVPYVSNDFLRDARVADAIGDAIILGVRAAAVLPLTEDGRRIGVLSVFAAEENFFDPELTRLVEEMAQNVSFAFLRHRSAAALVVSEERYRALFASSPDAIVVVRDGCIVLLNPAATRMFGAADERALIGRDIMGAIDPAYRAMAAARVVSVLSQGRAVPPAEFPMARVDGGRVIVEAVAMPFEYEGRPAVLSFLRDLTSRKQAQQRIGRLTSLYAALSRTNEAIFRITELKDLCQAVCEIAVAHGGLVSASIRAFHPADNTLVPYCGAGRLSGRLGADVIHLHDPGSNAAQIAREGGHYVCNDITTDPKAQASKADGDRIGVRASAGFALSIDGALAGTLSVFAAEIGYFDDEMINLLDELAHNLSFAFSRQKSAHALKQSEERYRMLFNAAPDAMRVVCGGRIVMFNPAAARLLGLDSPLEVIGQPLEVTIAPRDRAAAVERVRIVTEERRALPPTEQGLLRKDGGIVVCEIISLPFEYEGQSAALTIAHDLTARKAAERATAQINAELEERVQRRTGELKQALADLEAFSYTVAHDLRAPLRRMSGFAALLRDNLGRDLGEENAMFLERISDGAQVMDRLIEGLLEIAHLGRAELKPAQVDLSEEVLTIAGELHSRDPHRQVQFFIEPGLSAWADPRLLRDVLENLLGNAWKFTSGHPSAHIEFGAVRGDGTTGSGVSPGAVESPTLFANHGRECIFFVRDDGAGFDKKYAAKLFGTFQRLHTQDEFAGTGIGLASVKRIIANHGGRVWAEGEVEQGATFYFSLPLHEQEGG